MQGLDEQPANMPYEQTPLLVNNVDVAVAANALFGVTSALLRDPAGCSPHFDRSAARCWPRPVLNWVWWRAAAGCCLPRADGAGLSV
jgi:hypothetical protein